MKPSDADATPTASTSFPHIGLPPVASSSSSRETEGDHDGNAPIASQPDTRQAFLPPGAHPAVRRATLPPHAAPSSSAPTSASGSSSSTPSTPPRYRPTLPQVSTAAAAASSNTSAISPAGPSGLALDPSSSASTRVPFARLDSSTISSSYSHPTSPRLRHKSSATTGSAYHDFNTPEYVRRGGGGGGGGDIGISTYASPTRTTFGAHDGALTDPYHPRTAHSTHQRHPSRSLNNNTPSPNFGPTTAVGPLPTSWGSADSSYPRAAATAAPPAPHSARLFEPLLQQLTDVGPFATPPPPQKEKSSLEMEDDVHDHDEHGRTPPTGPFAYGEPVFPDRYHTHTPGIVSSNDGDGSSLSGPSRTSTPFHGEWAADGTDYESAFEGDAVIPMTGVSPAAAAAAASASGEPWNGKTAARDRGFSIGAAVRRGASAKSMRARSHVWGGGSGRSNSEDPLIGGGVGGVGGHANGSTKNRSWSSWLGSWRPSNFGGVAGVGGGKGSSSSSRQHRYQRLGSTDSPKSPVFRAQYQRRFRPKVEQFDPAMLASPRRLLLWVVRCCQSFLAQYSPTTVACALLFVAAFVASTTLLLIYILNPDKEPLPWRTYCANSQPFPYERADALAPVDVFVGVMTTDAKFDRRSVIRSTYAAHTRPIDPQTGLPTTNVQLKFIMGRPRKAFETRVALEMEMYNDIVVLDMKENMNKGKTHAYFSWAAENGTVPILRPRAGAELLPGRGIVQASDGHVYDVAWKKADYVVKADDDAFLMLDELERHLRVAPRKMTYWGYLIRNWFMGGETYALSADLVSFVASSPEVAAHVKGKEDKVTAKWMSIHPNASSINYVSEHCWIYDHPKSGTAYAHGFLFPDEVARIKLEERRGLSPAEVKRRGGERAAKWYSTVTRWKHKYRPPVPGLSVEEEVEALVEGGGLWKANAWRSGAYDHPDAWAKWHDRVYEADDARLKEHQGQNGLALPARMRADWKIDEWSSLPIYAPMNYSADAQAAGQARGDDAVAAHDARSLMDDLVGVISSSTSGAGDAEEDEYPADSEDAADEEEDEEDDDDDDEEEDRTPSLLDSIPLVGALKHLAGAASPHEAKGKGKGGAPPLAFFPARSSGVGKDAESSAASDSGAGSGSGSSSRLGFVEWLGSRRGSGSGGDSGSASSSGTGTSKRGGDKSKHRSGKKSHLSPAEIVGVPRPPPAWIPLAQHAATVYAPGGDAVRLDELRARRYLVGAGEDAGAWGLGGGAGRSRAGGEGAGMRAGGWAVERGEGEASGASLAGEPRETEPQAQAEASEAGETEPQAEAEAGEPRATSPSNAPATPLPPTLRGGTVVVHFLKRNEWFFETALALLGRDRLRGVQPHPAFNPASVSSVSGGNGAGAAAAGAGGKAGGQGAPGGNKGGGVVRGSASAAGGGAPGSEWTMWGSPGLRGETLVRHG